ncbi:MAG TPA: 4a-hydroxytetrahydrobiopterin dehydratase [Methylomirabilota bacterium]|jgi:4a-hydroxytetrahydrobiopterin dehydratase|nr:4a-hydroxytetrahydrobiopterin dehydratase [Methylomirabilota bacterium]
MNKPKVLTQNEIKKALKTVPGWKYADDKLTKEFEFTDFVGSLSFINRLVAFFQEMDHHPDCHIFYNKVKFELTRFDAGAKVTDRDILVALQINKTFATERKL